MLDTDFPYVYIGTLTLNQGPDRPLCHGQELWYIIQRLVMSYCPEKDYGYVCSVTLTFEIWPWFKIMTHPWVMDILSKSAFIVEIYGSNKNYGYVCTMTLTLEIWLWFKGMTNTWVEDNNHVKYYPDLT